LTNEGNSKGSVATNVAIRSNFLGSTGLETPFKKKDEFLFIFGL
jgi:hypothetical protein